MLIWGDGVHPPHILPFSLCFPGATAMKKTEERMKDCGRKLPAGYVPKCIPTMTMPQPAAGSRKRRNPPEFLSNNSNSVDQSKIPKDSDVSSARGNVSASDPNAPGTSALGDSPHLFLVNPEKINSEIKCDIMKEI